MFKRLAILGSTGSIGTQALEIVRQCPEMFAVEVLTAGKNYSLLIEQALEFHPNCVVIADESFYHIVSEALQDKGIKVFAGEESVSQVVEMETIDLVLVALVGFSGLKPTYQAVNAGKTIALANKETLVAGGDLITRLAREKGVSLYPVDSEHSAIFQCLAGEALNAVEKIILTASGGPFRGYNRGQLEKVTLEEAMRHPNWTMGPKVTIDSATLMNKGLEMIEAYWLFDLQASQIEIVIHPQSVIHSLVQFEDGSIKAQMGLPDMKLPISYALGYPFRVKNEFPRFSFTDYPNLSFESPDHKSFRSIMLTMAALKSGGNIPCALNACNEVAVNAFINKKIGFLDMPEIIEQCISNFPFIEKPSLEDFIQTDFEARSRATYLLK